MSNINIPCCFARHKPKEPNECSKCKFPETCHKVLLKTELEQIIEQVDKVEAQAETLAHLLRG